jgi:AraC family transcriptional regulator
MNASVRFRKDPAGVVEVPPRDHPVIVIHFGPSVYIHCRRGPWKHSGLSVHGDIDIVPTGVPGRWEMKEEDHVLALDVENQPGVEIVNRFQIRDPQIERLAWKMKTEMDAGYPNGRLYLDSLGCAVAENLFCRYSSASPPALSRGGLGGQRLKQVIAYIEDNLSHDLSLKEIADIAGVSVSHIKTTFRESVGLPVHQYVIQRRVDRAQMMLREGKLPISRIAAETGFAHQSHLSYHVRRILGVSPSESARRFRSEDRTMASDDQRSSRP